MPNPLATGREGDSFHFTLTLDAPAEAAADAARLSEALTPFLADADLTPSQTTAIHTALEELLTNLGKFGRTGSTPPAAGPLVASGEIAVGEGRVELRFRDNGIPFDPTGHPPPVFTDDPDSLEPGGLGLHMLKTMFTAYRYARTGELNTSLWRLDAADSR